MENAVPAHFDSGISIAQRSAQRALAGRYSAYLAEVQALIAAARRVMQSSGSVEARVSEIVREAGLSNQAFYRHFRSKHELLLAVLTDGYEQLVSYLEQRMAAEARPLGRIRRWLESIVIQAAQPQAAEAARIFVVNGVRLADQFPQESSRSVERIKAPLREALAQAAACGELPGADPERDAEALYQLAMGWMQQKILARARPSRADVEHVVRFALRGLRAEEVEHGA